MNTILGLDFGTQGAKGVIITPDGLSRSYAYSPYSIITKTGGIAEENPADWLIALKDICVQLELNDKTAFDSISAIGVSGQMHGFVPVDKNGTPVMNAMIWMDNRAVSECEAVEKALDTADDMTAVNPVTGTYSAPKILYLYKNLPEIIKKTWKLLFVKDYIKFVLCRSTHTDHSDASGTLLYNFREGKWDESLLSELGISSGILPDIESSLKQCGGLHQSIASALGLKSGIPVINGAGDLASGILGSGVVDSGQLLIMLSTSGQVMSINRGKSFVPLKGTHYFKYPDGMNIFALTSMPSAGMCLKWLSDILFKDMHKERDDIFSYMEYIANQSNIGSSGLLFMPYLQGAGNPHLDNCAASSFIGLRAYHQQSDFIRAVMEGVSFGLREAVESMGILYSEVLLAGGGAKSPLWSSMIADVLKSRLITVGVKDVSSFGAALIAATSIGVFDDFMSASKVVQTNKVIECTSESSIRYDEIYNIYKGMYSSLKMANKQLDDLYLK